MVRFLIHRPVAVTMAFLGLLLIGLATTVSLPVSLMPDIDIPVVSIRVSSTDLPARQLENTVVKPLRNVLKEVNNVESMKSETRDGTAWVELRFRHGTSIDLASVEVNEKVDKAMNYLPREMRRPEVIRASASDIPVFYLMVTQKGADVPVFEGNITGTSLHSSFSGGGILDLSNFSSQVIRKRLEQLPEVALVDMSGLQFPEIKITPRPEYLQSGAFSITQLEQALQENNIDLGNLLIRDGQYQYNIRFNTRLRDVSDIENIPVNLSGKVVKLKELAGVTLQPQQPQGSVRFNAKNAVSLAIIKQSDARMAGLRKELDLMVSYFREDYPELEFSVTRDQTRLLEYSISNLGQSLLIGGLLAFLSMFLFLRERRAPWLIGISIPVSLIITLLFFYLAGLSINIISLSGLVLGVGMMIDNSIIVIDNITQHRNFGNQTGSKSSKGSRGSNGSKSLKSLNVSNDFKQFRTLSNACANGTNEVIRPLITSVLTTCAVFIPLIFMKGMAGALFFDQAVAVSIGLVVSLIVSITLLPTLYRLFYRSSKKGPNRKEKLPRYFHWYETGLKFVLRHRFVSVTGFVLMLVMAGGLWFLLPVTQFPEVSHDEVLLEIDWNEPVTLDENTARTTALLSDIEEAPLYVIEEAGRQQYLLNSSDEAGISENRLYLKTQSPEALELLTRELTAKLKTRFPGAGFLFTDTENLFNLAFGKPEAPVVARFIHFNPGGTNFLGELAALQESAENEFGERVQSKLITRRLLLLETDPEKLLFYQVDHNDLYREVKSAFNANTVFTINDNNMYVPVSIGNRYQSVYEIVQQVTVNNRNGEQIPLSGLVKVSSGTGLKTIVAGKEGEYFPVMLDVSPREFPGASMQMKEIAAKHEEFDVTFGGSILSNRAMLKELLLIIGVSLLLLYFILAAQFESFVLPLIVLTEVPVNLFGVFLFLKLFGSGINIMSAIGIIVMAGIVINDSILKVDTINKLMDSGHSLLRSIFEGGRRRLKPIIMTSLTTILAMLPFLFQKGMGAELQKPLGLAIIGGMLVGTFVSLYLIPLMYYLLKRTPSGGSGKKRTFTKN
ncbi:MAG: efflux RND transporter permease subunit [Mariniphaga sp.]|nr:efflux RND transporter permease subunit [Mariniphaga sp.]